MPKTLTIALAQQNFLVGDIGGNVEKILAVAARAAAEGCDLVAFPEASGERLSAGGFGAAG